MAGDCWKGGFPTFPVLRLVIGILWLISELGVLTIDIPWWPIILIVVALGWVANSYKK
jgi:hypothetical protein